MIKVVVTGSESTGKTTLAHELGAQLGAPVAEEFVRTFAAGTGAITFADHGPIARGQMAAEDAAIAAASGIVVLDTDLVSTVVYCEHYFGRVPDWIVDEARRRAGDLYLLLRPDIPWVSDGIRDRGDRREEMHALFRSRLDSLRLPVVEIGGGAGARLESALRAVRAVTAARGPSGAG